MRTGLSLERTIRRAGVQAMIREMDQMVICALIERLFDDGIFTGFFLDFEEVKKIGYEVGFGLEIVVGLCSSLTA